MSDSFKSLMKGKGLLGGKYAPVAVMDGSEAKASMFEEDDLGEHNTNEITELKSRLMKLKASYTQKS